MRSNRIILIVSLIFLNIKIFSQTKVIYYDYNFVDLNLNKKDNNSFFNSIDNFKTKRVYKSENCFTEYGLLNSDTTFGLRFKIEKDKWFFCQKDKRINLYPNLKQRKIVQIDEDEYEFKFVGVELVNKRKTYKFEFHLSGFISSNKVYFFFSPEEGFIAISSHGKVFIRAASYP